MGNQEEKQRQEPAMNTTNEANDDDQSSFMLLLLPSSTWWKEVKDIINKFWDYIVNFLYVFISIGIILNLSGFAYTLDGHAGLRIVPVSQYRQELQWKREMQRYDRMYDGQERMNEQMMSKDAVRKLNVIED